MSRSRQKPIVATLGPRGTDSECAAKYFAGSLMFDMYGSAVDNYLHQAVMDFIGDEPEYEKFELAVHQPMRISLQSSFAEALQHVREKKADFGIVPAAFPDLLRFHYENRDLGILLAFSYPTKELVYAKKPGIKQPTRIALHPSTDKFSPEGLEKIYIHSKPLCVEAVVRGETDAAIGSRDVVENYGLEIIESFGEIPMSWEVFARRR